MKLVELVFFVLVLAGITVVYVSEMRLFAAFLKNKSKGRCGTILRTKRTALLHILAACVTLVLGYMHFIEPYWLQVNKVSIRTEKLKKTDLRVVQISDLHCEMKARNEKRMIKLINKLDPDVIIFSGDCLNSLDALGLFKQTLKSLNASIGKYAVKGDCGIHIRQRRSPDSTRHVGVHGKA